MYQDLIIPTSYTYEPSDNQSESSSKRDPNKVKTKLFKQLKLIEDLIEGKSTSKKRPESTNKEYLIKEHSAICQQLETLEHSSISKFKHRIEVNKIPTSIQHKSKSDLDKSLFSKPTIKPTPPLCIHFDHSKSGKVNSTTWRSFPKPSWKSHNKLDSTFSSTALEYLLYEEGQRFTHNHEPSLVSNELKYDEAKSFSEASRSQYSSPPPTMPKLSKAMSTQTARVTHAKKKIELERQSSHSYIPIASPPQTQASPYPPYTPQPIHIQMPIYNTLPSPYPAYQNYYGPYPSFYPAAPKKEKKSKKKEAVRQSKKVVEFGIQTIHVIEDVESHRSEETELEKSELWRPWAFDYGSGMTPAELLKRNQGLYLRLLQNQHPVHSICHRKYSDGYLNDLRNEIRKKRCQSDKKGKANAISKRFKKLSSPQHKIIK